MFLCSFSFFFVVFCVFIYSHSIFGAVNTINNHIIVDAYSNKCYQLSSSFVVVVCCLSNARQEESRVKRRQGFVFIWLHKRKYFSRVFFLFFFDALDKTYLIIFFWFRIRCVWVTQRWIRYKFSYFASYCFYFLLVSPDLYARWNVMTF